MFNIEWCVPLNFVCIENKNLLVFIYLYDGKLQCLA